MTQGRIGVVRVEAIMVDCSQGVAKGQENNTPELWSCGEEAHTSSRVG